MARGSEILLNGIQFATYRELQALADGKGVISGDVMEGYKANVVGALLRRNVLASARGKGAVRVTGVAVREAA